MRGNRSVASNTAAYYRERMAKAKEFLNNPGPINEEEDVETLAAIDEGIRNTNAGRTFSMEEVREQLRQWLSPKS
jgi:predicted transcriptional regulator